MTTKIYRVNAGYGSQHCSAIRRGCKSMHERLYSLPIVSVNKTAKIKHFCERGKALGSQHHNQKGDHFSNSLQMVNSCFLVHTEITMEKH